MSERMTSGPFEFDQKQLTAVRKVGDRALSIVRNEYGSGFPSFTLGRARTLLFHGVDHSARVAVDAARVGAQYGVNGSGRELLNTYGKSHDIRQRNGRGINEQLSADWLEEQILQEELPPLAARFGKVAVLGTLPLFDSNGVLIDQQVNHIDFESWEEELFAKSLASADLGDLYTPQGPLNSRLLYAEIEGVSDIKQEPSSARLLKFQEKQIALLEGYRYPLAEAHSVLATHRHHVINYQHFVHHQLATQRIAWRDLLSQDYSFMHNPEMTLK